MNVHGFLYEYERLIATDAGEGPFSVFQMMCPGLGSPKLGKLINRAVSYCGDNEIYCEVGTFVGYTLLSASLHNHTTPCVGVDNFVGVGAAKSEEEQRKMRNRLASNMSHFNHGNHQFMETDYKKINGFTSPIGVFFLDVFHDRKETYDGLKWVYNKLADEAIIFIDGISVRDTVDGVNDFVKEYSDECVEVFKMHNYYPESTGPNEQWANSFWQGLSIIKFKRKKETKGEIENVGDTNAEGCKLL